MDIEAKLIKI